MFHKECMRCRNFFADIKKYLPLLFVMWNIKNICCWKRRNSSDLISAIISYYVDPCDSKITEFHCIFASINDFLFVGLFEQLKA